MSDILVIRSADPSMFEDVSDDETTLADISELRDFDEDENQDSGRKANPVKVICPVFLYIFFH